MRCPSSLTFYIFDFSETTEQMAALTSDRLGHFLLLLCTEFDETRGAKHSIIYATFSGSGVVSLIAS